MLVAKQHREGVGVFSCDAFALFSNTSSEELFRPGFRPPQWPMAGPKVSVVEGSMELEPPGAGFFARVWDRLFEDGLHRGSDWTLRFDPDAAFLPGRLRQLLGSVCPPHAGACGPVHVEGPGSRQRRPVEALSHQAAEDFERGAAGCRRALGRPQEGAEHYMARCLRWLGVPAVQLPELLNDAGPGEPAKPECSTRHAAHHPLKLWDDYLGCLARAGYLLSGPAGKGDRWGPAGGPRGRPRMFCWALALASGPEPALLLRQAREGLGVFSCDAHLVVGNASLRAALPADASGLRMAVIDASVSSPRGGRYDTALNSPVFIEAWRAVLRDGWHRSHDWTLKLDADAVFVPERVRGLLGHHCGEGRGGCGAKYLTNYGGDLHGPAEALSWAAVERYREGQARCAAQVDYSDKGEDWYLGLCLRLLGVKGEEEPRLVSDGHMDSEGGHMDRGSPRPCDTVHAVFHPFKSWGYYRRCLCESGYATSSCDRMMEPGTSLTRLNG